MADQILGNVYAQAYYGESSYYYPGNQVSNNDFVNTLSNVNGNSEGADAMETAAVQTMQTKPSYTRVITANIRYGELSAPVSNSDTAYSFQGVVQRFEIKIDVAGDNRTYTASGIDKLGNEFSKEIDPYNVDPVDADFTEFAALCAYICDTEKLADETMMAVDTVAPSNILEKRDYVADLSFTMRDYQTLSENNPVMNRMFSYMTRLMTSLIQESEKVWSLFGEQDGLMPYSFGNGSAIGSNETKEVTETSGTDGKDVDLGELSEEEWKRLIEKTDKEIEAAKESVAEKSEEIDEEKAAEVNISASIPKDRELDRIIRMYEDSIAQGYVTPVEV